MRKAKPVLNFIVQNRNILTNQIMPQIEAWIQSGPPKTYIRITTLYDIDSWVVVYESKKSAKPIINKIQ
jgi:hypothetical protein